MSARPEPRATNLSSRRRSNHPAIPVEAREAAETAQVVQAGQTVEPEQEPAADATEAPKKKMGRPKGTGSNRDTTTRSVTFTTPILEDALNAVEFLKSNPTAPRTFTSLVDLAVFKLVNDLRQEYNNGEPFPQREGKLKPGPR
ncbi:hypothetical protein JWS13_04240 (plasmid) [Rhodococcus pseudokoreensis]|uniref:Centromere-binding protein ParB C-terminal domain-containing protein n=1 Tax=Rhodococcus pseudokoreensis TaxID=2811421 RepID=A0A974ZRP7_9NOCA|nr:hypothetical protein [Rhodococcus pseudokoreensis]QSE87926.1 hypothetical protein JWS13_04240 [Rhodococcus pseudokoreensis]